MKKILSLLLSLILICCLVFALVGCEREKTYYWEFEKDYTHVTEIKIVVSPNGEGFDIDNYKVLKEIHVDSVEEVYDDVTSITMTRYYGSLGSPAGMCLLIKFDNEEFDVIARRESKHYRYDENGTIIGYNSWLSSNSDDFYSVIEKYLALD